MTTQCLLEDCFNVEYKAGLCRRHYIPNIHRQQSKWERKCDYCRGKFTTEHNRKRYCNKACKRDEEKRRRQIARRGAQTFLCPHCQKHVQVIIKGAA